MIAVVTIHRIAKMSTRFNRHPPLSPGSQASAFDHELVMRRIRKAGMETLSITSLSNGTGVKFILLGGAVLTVYNTGRFQVQGSASDDERKRLDRALRPRKV